MQFVERADGTLSCPFDHHSAKYAGNFFTILDELRDAGPIVWSDLYGGFWVATRYDVVRRLTVNSAAVSVAHGPDRKGGIAIPTRPGTKSRPLFAPGEIEGKPHDEYRLALNPHFSKAKVAEIQPLIQKHVDISIKRVRALGEFDLVHDFIASTLAAISCEHMGIAIEQPAQFFRSLADMVAYAGAADARFEEIAASFSQAWPTVVRIVAEHRKNPGTDVISHLVLHEDPAFSDEDIQMMLLNIALGSGDTTSALVGQSMIYLHRHPELTARLRTSPDEIRPAVEEFLRLFAVSMGAGRTVTKDIEIEGVTLKKGDRLWLSYPAANHDPDQFPDPYEFILDRPTRRHLAMGVGTHFCLGAHLAKAVAETTIRSFLTQVDSVFIDVDGAESNEDKNVLNQWIRIPARVS